LGLDGPLLALLRALFGIGRALLGRLGAHFGLPGPLVCAEGGVGGLLLGFGGALLRVGHLRLGVGGLLLGRRRALAGLRALALRFFELELERLGRGARVLFGLRDTRFGVADAALHVVDALFGGTLGALPRFFELLLEGGDARLELAARALAVGQRRQPAFALDLRRGVRRGELSREGLLRLAQRLQLFGVGRRAVTGFVAGGDRFAERFGGLQLGAGQVELGAREIGLELKAPELGLGDGGGVALAAHQAHDARRRGVVELE